MVDVSDRLGIGAFARAAGLSVSAVRFYGDRGLLPPADVDPATGYRTYDRGQVADAVLVRDLRRLGMGLREVEAYVAADAATRRSLVDQHLGGLERTLDEARAVAHALHHLRPQEPPVNPMTVPAAAFLAALDQVLPAAGTDPEEPVLSCVLVEASQGSLRLVATDRYRLAIRDLVATGGAAAAFRALVPAETLRRWRVELPAQGDLDVGVVDDHLVARSGQREVRRRVAAATFPAYEAVLQLGHADPSDGRPAQVVVDRGALLAALERLADADADAVLLSARAGELALVRRDEHAAVPSRYAGPPVDVALDPTFARDAVAAAVGPDVAVEITDALAPVVFRSADDGTYTTLLMPVRR